MKTSVYCLKIFYYFHLFSLFFINYLVRIPENPFLYTWEAIEHVNFASQSTAEHWG